MACKRFSNAMCSSRTSRSFSLGSSLSWYDLSGLLDDGSAPPILLVPRYPRLRGAVCIKCQLAVLPK